MPVYIVSMLNLPWPMGVNKNTKIISSVNIYKYTPYSLGIYHRKIT